MDKYSRIFSYSYPGNFVFDATVYAVKKNGYLVLLFSDSKAACVGAFRVKPPYVGLDRMVTFAIRDDNAKTNVIITECNRRCDLPDMFNKRYNKTIIKMNKLIVKYLEKIN